VKLNDFHVFYRVRMEGAFTLAQPASVGLTLASSSAGTATLEKEQGEHWVGLDHLLRTFKTYFYMILMDLS